jgi:hypothetical protein
VTRSAERAKHVIVAARAALGDSLLAHVAQAPAAAEWLDAQLVDRARLAPAPPSRAARSSAHPAEPLRAAARDVYGWFQRYRAGLREQGHDLPSDGLLALRQLYDALAKESTHAEG